MSKLLPSFRSIIDWSALEKRGELTQSTSTNAPLLGRFYKDHYQLELGLLDLFRYKKLTGRIINPTLNVAAYNALSFIALFCRIYQQLSPRGRNSLSSRFNGALNGSNTLAPIDHELSVAGYLMRKDWDVEFADLEGVARFDFIVSRKKARIELECKSVSGDRGRKVHRFEFYRLADMFRDAIMKLKRDGTGERLVTIQLPDRLDPDNAVMARLCQEAVTAFESAMPLFESPICKISQIELSRDMSHDARKRAVDEFLSTNDNKLFFNSGPRGETHVGLRVQSAKPDQLLTYIYKQLKDAHRQFSGRAPAAIWVNVQEIEPVGWTTLRSRSSLQVMSSRFLGSPQRAHVISLAYNSYGEVVRTKNYVSESGPVLHYDNETSAFYDPGVKELYL